MNDNNTIIESLTPYLPVVNKWGVDYPQEHKTEAKSISDFGFSRLPRYSSNKLLNTAKAVVVDINPNR